MRTYTEQIMQIMRIVHFEHFNGLATNANEEHKLKWGKRVNTMHKSNNAQFSSYPSLIVYCGLVTPAASVLCVLYTIFCIQYYKWVEKFSRLLLIQEKICKNGNRVWMHSFLSGKCISRNSFLFFRHHNNLLFV